MTNLITNGWLKYDQRLASALRSDAAALLVAYIARCLSVPGGLDTSDGHHWTWQSQADFLAAFPHWPQRTLARILKRVTESGVLVARRRSRLPTLYRIDAERYEMLICQNGISAFHYADLAPHDMPDWHDMRGQNGISNGRTPYSRDSSNRDYDSDSPPLLPTTACSGGSVGSAERGVLQNEDYEHLPLAFRAYYDVIGPVSDPIAKRLHALHDTYPEDWISDAFLEAQQRDKRSLPYIEAILRRWGVEGKDESTVEASLF